MSEGLQNSPLWGKQVEAGARWGSFAGWMLPLEFSGVVREVQAVRCRAGLFDVSHMGEIGVRGPGAEASLQRLLTNEMAELAPGKARYTLMLNEEGGVLEDLVACRIGPEEYLLVVNAANIASDLAWIIHRAGGGVEVLDFSSEYALLALQGPFSTRLLEGACGLSLQAVPPFGLARAELVGGKALFSRTGYTGEVGWEIFLHPQAAVKVWEMLLQEGGGGAVEPCGLAARDVLRLEAGLPLYGQDINQGVTPLEAGLNRFVKLEKEFVGRDALAVQAAQGPGRRLAGLVMLGRGVPRRGYPVWQEGRLVGEVTSGTYSPTLEAGLAFVYLPAESKPGQKAEVEIRGRRHEARISQLPFYRRGEAHCIRQTGATPGSTSGS